MRPGKLAPTRAPRREIGGGVAVDGAALGGGGAPLGLRDVLADRGKGGEGHLGTFALAEILARRVVAAHQGAVNEQVGITPDRRGEMRVAPEREAEMADILRAVERLRLAAQDELVDHRGVGRAGGLLQQAVEVARSHRLPLGEAQADALQPLEKLAQGLELGRVRRIVDAVHAGLVQFFQRLGGGDVGGDHEFFNQLVAVETLAPLDARDMALGIQDDAALREIEVECAALGPRLAERRESAVERRHDVVEERPGRCVRGAIARRLDLLVGQARRRAHEAAHEAVSLLMAVGAEPHMDGEAGARHVRFQRAQLVRQRLGQHRHDAVGEIDRVAALLALVVERIGRPHVPRHVGDGDEDVPAAFISRIGIRLGPHRVVEIARIAAVDGDERRPAQVGAGPQLDRPRGRRLGERRPRELGRDVVAVDGDEADRARLGGIAPSSPLSASLRSAALTRYSTLARRSVGSMRPPPLGSRRKTPSTRAGPSVTRRTTRAS